MSARFSLYLLALALLQPATWAQNRTVSTTILLSTGTSIPLAAVPPLSNQTAPPICDPNQPTCPACDGQTFHESLNSNYEVYCGAYISSSAISQQPTYITPTGCLTACDGFFGCTGAYINGDGSCTLSIGTILGTLELDGYIGFVSKGGTPVNTSSAISSPKSTMLATSTKSSLQPLVTSYGNVTSTTPALSYRQTIPSYPYANATLSTNSTFYTTGTATNPRQTPSEPCSLDNLSCPACNDASITDDIGIQYNVICDAILESDSRYVFAEPLPAAYCLAQCDERNSTYCRGAYWQDEECTLALGNWNGSRIQAPSYIAFIRLLETSPLYPTSYSTGTHSGSLPVSTGLSWPNTSAYPTGFMVSGGGTTTYLGTVVATITSIPVSTRTTTSAVYAPAPTCNPQSISCPECDGLRIVDGLNATYRLQCNFAPTCDDTQGFYGQWSLNLCMERCDADSSCLAAIFNVGHCDFCLGSMEGTYEEDVDYLVLIPELPAPSAKSSMSVSGVSSPSPTANCDPSNPICPECADFRILDITGDAFAVHCYDAPRCDSEIIINDAESWNECLENCGEDPICHSTSFYNSACHLCQVTSNSTLSLIAAGRPGTPHWTPMALVAERPVRDFSSVVSASTVDTSSGFAVPTPTEPPMFFTGSPGDSSTPLVTTVPSSADPTNNGPTPTPGPAGSWAGRHGGGRHGDGRHGGFGGRGRWFAWDGRRRRPS